METTLFLLLLPVVVLSLGIFVYKFQGKKDLLHLDLVQFLYTFVLAPMLFIWFKTFAFVLLHGNGLTEPRIFIIDTVITMVLLYLYAFIVMHSLTKTFRLKSADPLYNLFGHSEYIHLWLTHLVMVFSGMALIVALGGLNLFLPQSIELSYKAMLLSLLLSFILGVVGYIAIMMADPKQDTKMSFVRLTKLGMGGSFLVLMSGFFILTPAFNAHYLIYWFSLTFFAGMSTMGVFSYRSRRVRSQLEAWVDRLVHFDWGNNTQILHKSKDIFRNR